MSDHSHNCPIHGMESCSKIRYFHHIGKHGCIRDSRYSGLKKRFFFDFLKQSFASKTRWSE